MEREIPNQAQAVYLRGYLAALTEVIGKLTAQQDKVLTVLGDEEAVKKLAEERTKPCCTCRDTTTGKE